MLSRRGEILPGGGAGPGRSRRPELSLPRGEFEEAFLRLAQAYVLVPGASWAGGPASSATDPGAVAALASNAWRCEAACREGAYSA